jgi:hypothetical protein
MTLKMLLEAAGLIVVGAVGLAARRAIAAKIIRTNEIALERADGDREAFMAEGAVTLAGAFLVLAGVLKRIGVIRA